MKVRMSNPYRHIQAYPMNGLLQITDYVALLPFLRSLAKKTCTSLTLDYAEGQKETIEQDIKHGAMFMTNHRDIVMDAGFLTLLVRAKYNIRPYVGMGNNLFGKWWIKPLARFNHAFVVIRDGGPREIMQHSQTMASYLRFLRRKHHSIWLAQREGRAKDSDDRTQPAVLKMLTLGFDKSTCFLDAMKEMNICPVSISYEFDPCDYLKAQEMQQKRDDAAWTKSKHDDIVSMKTGIIGHKGRVVFRLTPSVNHWIDANREKLDAMTRNEQILAVAAQIDRQIHQNYELFERGEEFTTYLQQQVAKVDIPDKDEAFLLEKMNEMYTNPVKNYEASNLPGEL